jgi:hypothetical protein
MDGISIRNISRFGWNRTAWINLPRRRYKDSAKIGVILDKIVLPGSDPLLGIVQIGMCT